MTVRRCENEIKENFLGIAHVISRGMEEMIAKQGGRMNCKYRVVRND